MSIQESIKIIENSNIDYFWQGKACSSTILEIENKLGITIPSDFKQFLLETGGGGFIDYEISGIEDNDPSNDNGGTIIGDTFKCRQEYKLPNNLIVIYFKDDEICWCLDEKTNNVISFNVFTGTIDKKISDTFEQFLSDYAHKHS
jgi:hypothetical protein